MSCLVEDLLDILKLFIIFFGLLLAVHTYQCMLCIVAIIVGVPMYTILSITK